MHDFCAIEDDQLLLKKQHNGYQITLYLKINGLDLKLIDTKTLKKINQITKILPLKNNLKEIVYGK